MQNINCFRPELPFLGEFGPKNQNYQFKLKCNIQNQIEYAKFNGTVYFFCTPPQIPSLGKFSSKKLKLFVSWLKFSTYSFKYAEINGAVHFF